MDQISIVLIYMLFYMSSTKNPHLSRFNLISNLGKIQDGDILVTSQAFSSATTHKIYLILLRRSKAFHFRFEILQHIKNSGEGFHHPLYHGGGTTLPVRPRVNYPLPL